MGGSNGRETTELLIDAIRKTNQRAIIQAGWGRLGTEETSPDIFCTEYVPHQWLFPKGFCVVHHGGAGTTASVCRAKVPSVVVAHHADQPYWGKRLSDLGVAPAASVPSKPYRQTFGETDPASPCNPRDGCACTGFGRTDRSRRRFDDSR